MTRNEKQIIEEALMIAYNKAKRDYVETIKNHGHENVFAEIAKTDFNIISEAYETIKKVNI